MICKQCGQTVKDGEIVCPKCRSLLVELKIPNIIAVEETEDMNEDENNSNHSNAITSSDSDLTAKNTFKSLLHKHRILVGSGILIIILITALGWIFYQSNRKPKDEYTFYSDRSFTIDEGAWGEKDGPKILYDNGTEKDGPKILYDNGTEKEYDIDGCKLVNYNLDRTACGVIDDNYRLYYVTGQGKEFIRSRVVNFRICPDGTKLAYTISSPDGGLDLYLYDTVTKNEKLVEPFVSGQEIVMSPDGSSIVFTKYAMKDGKYKSYLYHNDKVEYLGEAKYALAVSNDAKYIYQMISESELLIRRKGHEPIKITSTEGEVYTSIFNEDCSEFLYTTADGTFVCLQGDKIIKLSNSKCGNIILPEKVAQMGVIYGVRTLKNKLYMPSSKYEEYKYYFIIDQPDMESEAASMEGAAYLNDKDKVIEYEHVTWDNTCLSKTDKSFIYLSEGTLYYVRDYSQKTKGPESLVDENSILKYCCTEDLSILYYVTEEGLLYRKVCGEDIVLLAKQVRMKDSGGDIFCYDNEQDIIYFHFNEDDKDYIYYSIGGNGVQPIFGEQMKENPLRREIDQYENKIYYIETIVRDDYEEYAKKRYEEHKKYLEKYKVDYIEPTYNPEEYKEINTDFTLVHGEAIQLVY